MSNVAPIPIRFTVFKRFSKVVRCEMLYIVILGMELKRLFRHAIKLSFLSEKAVNYFRILNYIMEWKEGAVINEASPTLFLMSGLN